MTFHGIPVPFSAELGSGYLPFLLLIPPWFRLRALD